MPSAIKKPNAIKRLTPHFEEIKILILMNSSASIAESLNEKYDLDVCGNDIDNFIYGHKADFDVADYRKKSTRFDFNKAKQEATQKQFHATFP